jgi:hypothetical protein
MPIYYGKIWLSFMYNSSLRAFIIFMDDCHLRKITKLRKKALNYTGSWSPKYAMHLVAKRATYGINNTIKIWSLRGENSCSFACKVHISSYWLCPTEALWEHLLSGYWVEMPITKHLRDWSLLALSMLFFWSWYPKQNGAPSSCAPLAIWIVQFGKETKMSWFF